MFASYGWGRAADVYGRRPISLLTISLMSCEYSIISAYAALKPIFLFAVFTFLFGWSNSLWFAVATRFLTGLSGGIITVSKTTISEV